MGCHERVGQGSWQGPLLEAAQIALVEEEGEREPPAGRGGLTQRFGREQPFGRQEQLERGCRGGEGLQLRYRCVGRAQAQLLLDGLSHQLAVVGGHENPLLIIAAQEALAPLGVVAHGDGQLRLLLGGEGVAGVKPFPQLFGFPLGEGGHPDFAFRIIDQREGEPFADALWLAEGILREIGPQQSLDCGQRRKHQLQGLWLMQAEHRLGWLRDERKGVCLADGLSRMDSLGEGTDAGEGHSSQQEDPDHISGRPFHKGCVWKYLHQGFNPQLSHFGLRAKQT